MRVWVETTVFLGLAAAVHAAVIVTSLDGAGQGGPVDAPGKPILSFAAAPPDLAHLIEDWSVQPDVSTPGDFTEAPSPDAPPNPSVASEKPPAPARRSVPVATPDGGDAIPVALPLAPATPEAPLAALPERQTASGTVTGSVPVMPDRQNPVLISPPRPTAPVAEATSPDLPLAEPEPLPVRAMRAPPPRPKRSTAGSPQVTQRAAPAPAQNSTARQVAARAQSAGPSPAVMAAWGSAIRARVNARATPPPGTWSPGRALLRITVSRDGRVASARILQSAGDTRLDRAALRAVSRAGRMPRAPEGLSGQTANFDLPVAFSR